MRFNKIYSLGLALSMLFTYSCKMEVEDIFNESASERIEQAKKEYKEVLCGAKNGWEMQYFANDGEAGVVFLMKFNEDGSVKIASKSQWTDNKYKDETSLFDMIGDDGPVLTFNTYNSILHMFADPYDIPSTAGSETGRGHEGDYEFVVQKADANEVILTGKKHKLVIVMHPVEAETSWEEVFTKIDDLKAKLFSDKIAYVYLTANQEKFLVAGQQDGEISLYPELGDPITDTNYAVFLVHSKGIRFCTPYKGYDGKFSVQNFEYVEDGGYLLCTDDNKSTIEAAEPLKLFQSNISLMKWRINSTETSGAFAADYDNVVKCIKAGLNQNLVYMQFEFKTVNKEVIPVLSFKSGASVGSFYGKYTEENGKLVMNFDGTGDKNSQNYYNSSKSGVGESFKTLLAEINAASFSVSSTSKILPVKIKLTSVSNEANSITVDAQ